MQNCGTCIEVHHYNPAMRSFQISNHHQAFLKNTKSKQRLVVKPQSLYFLFFYYYYFCAQLKQAATTPAFTTNNLQQKTQGENQLLPSLVAQDLGPRCENGLLGCVSYHSLLMHLHLASASVDFLCRIKDSVCLKNHFSLCPTLLKCQHLGI